MSVKPFQAGILVGRFQLIHTGHMDLIRKASALCRRVCILVGSSQEEGTACNPFSFALRAEMLRTLFPEPSISICPLPDLGAGNCAAWGNYVLQSAKQQLGLMPDLMVSGKEERRVHWFTASDGGTIAELFMPKNIPVSSSMLRRALAEDDRALWQQYTSPLLWPRYEALRALVCASTAP